MCRLKAVFQIFSWGVFMERLLTISILVVTDNLKTHFGDTEFSSEQNNKPAVEPRGRGSLPSLK